MSATPLKTSARAASRPLRHRNLWHFAPLQRLAETAAFAPVDLTDTIFTATARPATARDDAGVPAVPFTERPDHARMLTLRLP